MNTSDLEAENSMLRSALQEANAQRDAAVAVIAELRELAIGCATKRTSCLENAERDAGYSDVGRAMLKMLEKFGIR